MVSRSLALVPRITRVPGFFGGGFLLFSIPAVALLFSFLRGRGGGRQSSVSWSWCRPSSSAGLLLLSWCSLIRSLMTHARVTVTSLASTYLGRVFPCSTVLSGCPAGVCFSIYFFALVFYPRGALCAFSVGVFSWLHLVASPVLRCPLVQLLVAALGSIRVPWFLLLAILAQLSCSTSGWGGLPLPVVLLPSAALPFFLCPLRLLFCFSRRWGTRISASSFRSRGSFPAAAAASIAHPRARFPCCDLGCCLSARLLVVLVSGSHVLRARTPGYRWHRHAALLLPSSSPFLPFCAIGFLACPLPLCCSP